MVSVDGIDVTDRQWDRLQLAVFQLSRDDVLRVEEIAAASRLDEELVQSVMDAIAERRHSDVERRGDGQWELTTPTVVVEEPSVSG